jgi:hypothetical protein
VLLGRSNRISSNATDREASRDPNADKDKRAEAYVVWPARIGTARTRSDLPTNKITTINPTTNKATLSYKKPKEKDFKLPRPWPAVSKRSKRDQI